jgi:hypothetical protein
MDKAFISQRSMLQSQRNRGDTSVPAYTLPQEKKIPNWNKSTLKWSGGLLNVTEQTAAAFTPPSHRNPFGRYD